MKDLLKIAVIIIVSFGLIVALRHITKQKKIEENITNPISKLNSEENEIDKYKITQFIRNFQFQNMDWTNNNITIEKYNVIFRDSIKNYFEKTPLLFNDQPFNLEKITKISANKYLAYFVNYNDNDSEYQYIKINVIGYIDEKMMVKLKENYEYRIDGTFITFLKEDGNLNTFIGVDPDETLKLYLGTSFIKIKSAEIYF